jgi:hypothetical protein
VWGAITLARPAPVIGEARARELLARLWRLEREARVE